MSLHTRLLSFAALVAATFAAGGGQAAAATVRPAHPGEAMILYGVGFGPVSPNISAGDVVQSENQLALPFQIFFGGTPALVSYAGLAPGTVGLYQFNVVVPDIPAGEAVPVTFVVNGNPGQQILYTAIE